MLEARSIHCKRSLRPVFKEVSFRLDTGGALIVMGPNGSGKSSLLRIVSGLLTPSSGGLYLDGHAMQDDPAFYRDRCAYIGHLDALKSNLTVDETITYWRALCNVGADSTDPLPSAHPLDAFDLRPFATKQVRYLSHGQRRRLTLSRLVLTKKAIWILDEPLTALDNSAQRRLLDVIDAHRVSGGKVIVATHQDIALPKAQHMVMEGHL